MADDDDDIPLLEDIIRPGAGPQPKDAGGGPTLTADEIEAIAARVVERHGAELEAAVARAIRAALDIRAGHERRGSDDLDR
ncbi:MAG: hypothetical protein U5K43_14195 [Halofilum sp. (in: g-proteobacteria)]|nr:hypothetical protein [Halofilum sp. (in: g-proteobacteria)]